MQLNKKNQYTKGQGQSQRFDVICIKLKIMAKCKKCRLLKNYKNDLRNYITWQRSCLLQCKVKLQYVDNWERSESSISHVHKREFSQEKMAARLMNSETHNRRIQQLSNIFNNTKKYSNFVCFCMKLLPYKQEFCQINRYNTFTPITVLHKNSR